MRRKGSSSQTIMCTRVLSNINNRILPTASTYPPTPLRGPFHDQLIFTISTDKFTSKIKTFLTKICLYLTNTARQYLPRSGWKSIDDFPRCAGCSLCERKGVLIIIYSGRVWDCLQMSSIVIDLFQSSNNHQQFNWSNEYGNYEINLYLQ